MRVLLRLGRTRLSRPIRPQSYQFVSFHQRRRAANYASAYHAASLSILPTAVDTSSADFKENDTSMTDLVSRMQELHATIEQGGSAKARDKHEIGRAHV